MDRINFASPLLLVHGTDNLTETLFTNGHLPTTGIWQFSDLPDMRSPQSRVEQFPWLHTK